MDKDRRAGVFSAPSTQVVHMPVARMNHAMMTRGSAMVVTAMVCAMSGFVMGLAVGVAGLQLLAFLCGALLAGGAVWFGRPLMQRF